MCSCGAVAAALVALAALEAAECQRARACILSWYLGGSASKKLYTQEAPGELSCRKTSSRSLNAGKRRFAARDTTIRASGPERARR